MPCTPTVRGCRSSSAGRPLPRAQRPRPRGSPGRRPPPLPRGSIEPPRHPGIREARRSRARAAEPPANREDALFEAATAVLAQQEQTQRARELTAFQSRTLAEGQTQFTGEPISLDLKDADIKDVFRTISQFTGLNIVIDPEVKGTVTVQLENVPWDQALDLILKQNNLGYVLDNNII